MNTVTSKTNRMVRRETAKITDSIPYIFLENIPITATLVRPNLKGEDPIQIGGFIVTDDVKNTQTINKFLMVADGFFETIANELKIIAKEKEAGYKQESENVQIIADTDKRISVFDRIKELFENFRKWLNGEG